MGLIKFIAAVIFWPLTLVYGLFKLIWGMIKLPIWLAIIAPIKLIQAAVHRRQSH